MSFSDPISRQAVLAAILEYDRVGRGGFLRTNGYGEARIYFLIFCGKPYDSKAIIGVAHGYEYPQLGPLRASDFSGGNATVKRKLEKLGFEVLSAKARVSGRVGPRLPE